MKTILRELTETISSRGAIVMLADGMLVCADVRDGPHEDRLAALGAAILSELGTSLRDAGVDEFRQIEIAAEHGKVVLAEAGATYLLVLLGPQIEIGPASIEIQSAATKLAKLAEFATA